MAAALTSIATSQAVATASDELSETITLNSDRPVAVRHLTWDMVNRDIGLSDVHLGVDAWTGEDQDGVTVLVPPEGVEVSLIPDDPREGEPADGWLGGRTIDLTEPCRRACHGGATVVSSSRRECEAHTMEEGQMKFERFAGVCGIGAGLFGFAYAYGFVLAKDPLLYGTALLVGALLGLPVIVVLYLRVVGVDHGFAMLGLLLAAVGALGAAIHGGYDLANALHPPAGGVPDLPSAIDPRGMLTLLATGLGLILLASLIVRGRTLPAGIGYLGIALGVVLVLVYLGRLIVLDPTSPFVLGHALIAGVASPLLYVWIGAILVRGDASRNQPGRGSSP
jgi:hypothetical protein